MQGGARCSTSRDRGHIFGKNQCCPVPKAFVGAHFLRIYLLYRANLKQPNNRQASYKSNFNCICFSVFTTVS
jgi:hypothetical protein